MIKKPFVSICIITYNHEKYIEKTLHGSLFQEGNFEYEIVISDDNSSDSTAEICEKYKVFFPEKIKFFRSKQQKGMVANWKDAILNCSGKYIAICEGDDYWTDPYKLQKQVDFLENNPEYGMIASDIDLVDEKGDAIPDNAMVIKQREFRKPEPTFFDLLQINTINTLTTCIRADLIKDLVKRVQKDDLWFVYDYWFWLNISINHKIKLLFDKTAAYRVHSLGASRQTNFFKKRKPLVVSDAIIHYLKTRQKVNWKVLSRNIKGLMLNRHFSIINKLYLLYCILIYKIAIITKKNRNKL